MVTPMMQRYLFDHVLLNRVHQCEALELCALLPDQSVDMILCDLPYGTTACAWDVVIPFEPMWAAFKRVIKPRGAIVLTASQPFTSALVMSNPAWFRCEWIIRKPQGTGYMNSGRQPMKNHEVVIVFAEGVHNYYPQKRAGKPYVSTRGNVGGFVRDKSLGGYLTINNGDRFPLSVIDTSWNTLRLHPTEKPVDVFEYLIKTYTREGDVVFDPTCGSGTTGAAARNCKRRFILGEKEAEYVAVTRDRLRMPFERRHVPIINDVSDLPLFAQHM